MISIIPSHFPNLSNAKSYKKNLVFLHCFPMNFIIPVEKKYIVEIEFKSLKP